jgi:hypothetical protein
MVLYAGALFVVKGLTRADVDFARDTLHPGKMLRYIGGEVRQKKD